MNDTFYKYISLGSTKTKQVSDRLEYITHLHQHTWSIHNSYVSRMCIQNIVNIFAGFWIRACWISAKFTKINVPQIFPLLQYMVFQSNTASKIQNGIVCDLFGIIYKFLTQTAPFIIKPVDVRFNCSVSTKSGKFDHLKMDWF